MRASQPPIFWKTPASVLKQSSLSNGSIIKQVVCQDIAPVFKPKSLLFIGADNAVLVTDVLSCTQLKKAQLVAASRDVISKLENTLSVSLENKKPTFLSILFQAVLISQGFEPSKKRVKYVILEGAFPSEVKLKPADLVFATQTFSPLAQWGETAKAAYFMVRPGGVMVLLAQGDADCWAHSVISALPVDTRFEFLSAGENNFIVAHKKSDYIPPMIDGVHINIGDSNWDALR